MTKSIFCVINNIENLFNITFWCEKERNVKSLFFVIVSVLGFAMTTNAQPQAKQFADAPIIIKVDRSVAPVYPEGFVSINPRQELVHRPDEYDLSTVGIWYHDNQKTGRGFVSGLVVYEQLRQEHAFVSCLNLQDGLAIQQKGVDVFRKFFAGKEVFLWGSLVMSDYGEVLVPSLYEEDGEVEVGWSKISQNFDSRRPALMYHK